MIVSYQVTFYPWQYFITKLLTREGRVWPMDELNHHPWHAIVGEKKKKKNCTTKPTRHHKLTIKYRVNVTPNKWSKHNKNTMPSKTVNAYFEPFSDSAVTPHHTLWGGVGTNRVDHIKTPKQYLPVYIYAILTPHKHHHVLHVLACSRNW